MQLKQPNVPEKLFRTMRDLGGYFAFFTVLYLIFLIKITSHYYIGHSYFFTLYSILIGLYILSRFLLAYFYSSISYDENYEPTVTFVVPAKNEEDNIAETIRRFTVVDYPFEKIEIVAINDGSTDDTLGQMLLAQKECQEKDIQMEVVNWEVNRGKRDGMAEGVKRASNDIVIFVDSDSFIEPTCVKHLVKFFSNPRVGAVSGHTDVYNHETNLLTKMQSLRYYIAFKVYKAAESIFGNVTCCPGCCSAYRRSYIEPVLNAWLHQSFLGVRCTFGDDRSLTNFVIRKYEAVYSPEAKAFTVVPDNIKTYIRQQQRWKKSWIRETFIAGSFMWRKNIFASLSFYSYMFLAFAAPIVFINALFYYPIFKSHVFPSSYLIGLGLMLILHGIYYKNHYKSSSWFLPVITFWFYSIILIWQLPWAFITMNDTKWGTR